MNAPDQRAPVPLGYISGVHGVKGWVKIHSWTRPREAILKYQPWLLGEEMQAVRMEQGRAQGKNVLACLPGCTDREQAQALVGREIHVLREQLPDAGDDSWYWSDLVGLAVVNQAGESLGQIAQMMETGAHDVMVVDGDRQRLIPFVTGIYVLKVDLDAGTVEVDWQADYLA